VTSDAKQAEGFQPTGDVQAGTESPGAVFGAEDDTATAGDDQEDRQVTLGVVVAVWWINGCRGHRGLLRAGSALQVTPGPLQPGGVAERDCSRTR
jgi:hypothetical protein